MPHGENQKGQSLPIEWYVPEGLPQLYANNLVIQHTDSEFILSFFAAQLPILLEEDPVSAARLGQIDTLRARCVAQIIISPPRMKGFLDALERNYARFAQQHSAPAEESAND